MTAAREGWTPKRVADVELLWRGGLSAGQIAIALGGGVTRNAVIGKIHRLGLKRRADTRPAAPVARRPAKVTPARTPEPVHAPPAEIPAPPPAEHRTGPVSLLELRDGECRYPIGDPGTPSFGFCGSRVHEAGASYCAKHHRLCVSDVVNVRRLARAVR